MKKITMKGKNVDDAVKAALEVLGGDREKAKVQVIKEGKPAMLGVIGGEEAEVEVTLSEGLENDGKQILEEILSKMGFMAMVEAEMGEGAVELNIKGEDMGRIIGKEGQTLKSLQILVGTMLGRMNGERVRVNIDADGYKQKRGKALERLAKEVAEEVEETGKEKILPPMTAADRRTIHLFLQENPRVTSYSTGEGKDRRLVIAPRQE